MESINTILKRTWGYDKFRPLQEEIITSVLQGKDCLALLPTGGGKSLCFQVPALAMNGLCLVVSPLIALMKDQVENLRKKNITAFSIHSGMSRNDVKNTLKVAGNSNCKLLYVSPERLETSLFKEYILSLNISLIAVDEAHCISQWGYDFRPSYLRIAELREELPEVPVLALSASATPEVQKDICDKLLFREQLVFRQSFERPNLSYSAFVSSPKINKIIEIFSKVSGTGIVYCRSRRKTKEISDLLNMAGIKSDYYHAGLTQEQRNLKQENWLQNKLRVIVCTNAFGMGIDKPDVRVVVHSDVPDCLENYYQEAGRAGRDGKKSYAVLLYDEKELNQLRSAVQSRFPNVGTIRTVYKSLANYLQVAAESAEGMSYEFDLTHFVKTFKLETQVVISSLKILEQEELIVFNEQVFTPSKIQVSAGRERLAEIEKMSPTVDALIKFLLRTYEGIIDQETSMSEKMIAGSLKISQEQVTNQLIELQKTGFIKYIQRKEKPQIFFPVNRVRVEDLVIDESRIEARKAKYLSRAAEMINFATAIEKCRSMVIGNYFGDAEMKKCGICDNCIRLAKKPMAREEFEAISARVVDVVGESPATLQQVLLRLNEFPQDRTREVLRFMQAEEKIALTEKGNMFLK